jgi:hypothetical protein
MKDELPHYLCMYAADSKALLDGSVMFPAWPFNPHPHQV